MKKRVFITGATGFVGRHLIKALSSSEREIFGSCFPEHPEHCRIPEEVKLIHLDIRQGEELKRVIKEIRPGYVFHLAAVSNVRRSWEDRKGTMEVNLVGTFNLLEAVRSEAPQARVLFISSSDVYGVLEPTDRPLRESDEVKAVNPYAFSKASGEMLCQFYSLVKEADVVISRSFPHTGPGQSPDFVCSDWAFQLARIERGDKEPVIEVGNLEIKRDFSDVRDTVRGYISLVEKGRCGEIYNVCSGRAIPLSWILKTLADFSSKKVDIRTDPAKLRKTDIPVLYGDRTKIKKETGWEPAIPLEETLLQLLEFWRDKLDSNKVSNI